jgi:hypothetical protein
MYQLNSLEEYQLTTVKTTKQLISLVTPTGFEPVTHSLEGCQIARKVKVQVDIFSVRSRFDVIHEIDFVHSRH